MRRSVQKVGLVAPAPGPRTSRRNRSHEVYPYLLRNIRLTRANQVWCAGATYIPMVHGFWYLVTVMDWHARHAY
jgi:putative transposase